MLANQTVAVVVPAYNEERQIRMVLDTVPDFVDRIVVVNDGSGDTTADVVRKLIEYEQREVMTIDPVIQDVEETRYNQANRIAAKLMLAEEKLFTPSEVINKTPSHSRIILINHLNNAGVGAAVATGYKWCRDHGIDCVAKIDGDGQMDPEELASICGPVVSEGVDYVKGNRLIHSSAWVVIPRIRYFGNAVLSILTKVASGYWHVSDTQTAYTAISRKALEAVPLHKLYPSYGYPNDLLVKLNIAFCTLKEVEIKPIYDVGEQSKMKIAKVIPMISGLLIRNFFKRLWGKYLFRDFHPLFLLYHFSFVLFAIAVPYGIKILNIALAGERANPVTVLAFMFLAISSFQSGAFAMWMDIQDNERLNH